MKYKLVGVIFVVHGIMYGYAESSSSPETRRAIVIGASVGMGREVAKCLAAEGYIVGVAARRRWLLDEVCQEIPAPTYSAYIDASDPLQAVTALQDLIERMGGVDLLVIAITGFHEAEFSGAWSDSLPVLNVDVVGFFALARTGLDYFEHQGHGHLVGFSSIDAIKGVASCPAYSAAKAFCIRYLEAERNKYSQRHVPIVITTLVPGWVNSNPDINYTDLPQAYWVESLQEACDEVCTAIRDKVAVAYITPRWKQVADLLTVIPDDLYNALSARVGGAF